jgi:hypothetical protein
MTSGNLINLKGKGFHTGPVFSGVFVCRSNATRGDYLNEVNNTVDDDVCHNTTAVQVSGYIHRKGWLSTYAIRP